VPQRIQHLLVAKGRACDARFTRRAAAVRAVAGLDVAAEIDALVTSAGSRSAAAHWDTELDTTATGLRKPSRSHSIEYRGFAGICRGDSNSSDHDSAT
jgi:hypothetical protein